MSDTTIIFWLILLSVAVAWHYFIDMRFLKPLLEEIVKEVGSLQRSRNR